MLLSFITKGLLFRKLGCIFYSSRSLRTTMNLRGYTLSEFCDLVDNSFIHQLKEDEDGKNVNQYLPRQIKNAHFVYVKPEPVQSPFLVATSKSCLRSLMIDENEKGNKKFIELFSGNNLLDGFDKPWASVYGCHCYGSWFGQVESIS